VYRWNGTIAGQRPASGPDWTRIIGQTPNAPIAKIAFASRMPGPNWYGSLAVGGSRLWAIDTASNIYVAEDVAPINNQK
jgi:hypothetical protein